MFSRTFAALAATLAIATVALPSPQAAEPVKPPVTKRATVTTEHHGIAHTDDYAWLKTDEAGGDPRASPRRWRARSAPISTPRAPMPAPCWRPIARSSAAWWRRCAGVSAGATRRCRSRGGRGSTSRAIPSARSASCTAGGRATAGPSRSCSTRTCWRADAAPSPSPRSPSAPTTSCWPIRSTRTARSATSLKVRDLATGRDLADSDCRGARHRRVVARQPMAVLRRARPRQVGAEGLSPSARHADRRGPAGLRGERRRASPSRCG